MFRKYSRLYTAKSESTVHTILTGYGFNLWSNIAEALSQWYTLDKPQGGEDVGNVVEPSATSPQALTILTSVAHQHLESIVQ